MARLDAGKLPWCDSFLVSVESKQHWRKSIDELYGNKWYQGPNFELEVGENVNCQRLCAADVATPSKWNDAILEYMHYHFYIDNLPLVWVDESSTVLSQNYWQGTPVGLVLDDSHLQQTRYQQSSVGDVTVNNHFRFIIEYKRESDQGYRIVQTKVQPMSLKRIDDTDDVNIASSRPSCRTDAPMQFDDLESIPPQNLDSLVWYTYDVEWVETDKSDRWKQFLTMDSFIRVIDQVAGLLLALLIVGILTGVTWTWVNRDLSYKPLVAETEDINDEAAQEIELWPLSTRVFFPPHHFPVTMCIVCGVGAQLFVSTLVFVFFFQFGILNQSLGSSILTGAAVIYVVSAGVGGYVTGRLARILHINHEKNTYACIGTASSFPCIGIIACCLSYDVFSSSDAPSYGIFSSFLVLLLLWVLLVLPLTIFSGALGHRHGPLDGFPISEGSSGYQDLNLQSENDTSDAQHSVARTRLNLSMVLLFGGVLPTLTAFIPFSYGIAGPVIVGFYSSTELWSLLFLLLYSVCVGFVSILLFYRQIRINNFQWWWSAFFTGGSAGLGLYLLTWSWLFFNLKAGRLSGGTFASYFVWFTFVCSGIALMSGSIAILSCIWFCRQLYAVTLARAQLMVPSEWSSSPDWFVDKQDDWGIQQVEL